MMNTGKKGHANKSYNKHIGKRQDKKTNRADMVRNMCRDCK
jgi:hypothetical protein